MRYPDREELKEAILTVLQSAPTRPPSRRGYSSLKVAHILRVQPGRTSPILKELEEEGTVEIARILDEDPPGYYYQLSSQADISPSPRAEQAHKRYQTKQARLKEWHEENRRQMYEKMGMDY